MSSNIISWKKSIPVSIKHHENPFFSIQSAVDRAIEDFYHTFTTPGLHNQVHTHRYENLVINPLIDIVEDKGTFKINVEMPGTSESDIKVSIADGVLTIKGEKTSFKTSDKDKNYVVREIGYGSYERNIPLPEFIDLEKAKASFKKGGVLQVEIPRKAGAKERHREIRVEKATG